MQKNITIVAIAVLVFIGLIWIAKPSQSPAANLPLNSYDFGTISMAKGKVNHDFEITNSADQPMNISKIYTSCMCTTAVLTVDDKKFGPYGMPSHGPVPSVNQIIEPGKSATITAEFDPAAHGPAGIGQINRSIFVETASGDPLELKFMTFVTP